MADMLVSQAWFVGLFIVGIACVMNGVNAMQTYYLTDFCDKTFSFRHYNVQAFILLLTRNSTYSANMNCDMKVIAPSNNGIFFTFVEIDVFNCKDYADVYQYHIDHYQGLDPEICSLPPRKPLVSPYPHASIGFFSDSTGEGRGFKVIVTTFHSDDCSTSTEYRCTNGRCIDNNLVCSGYDNCGDNSNNNNCDNQGVKTSFQIIFGILSVLSFFGVFLFWHVRRRHGSFCGAVDCPDCPSCPRRPRCPTCPSLPSPSLPNCFRHVTDSRQPATSGDSSVTYTESACQTQSSPSIETPTAPAELPSQDIPPPYPGGHGPTDRETSYYDPPPSYDDVQPPRYEDAVRKQ